MQCACRARSRYSWSSSSRGQAAVAVVSPPSVRARSIPGETGRPATSSELQALVDAACSCLRAEHVERAHQLAAQLLAPFQGLVEGDPAVGLIFGVVTPSEFGLSAAARLEAVRQRQLLLELGQALSMVGEHKLAVTVLGAIAGCFYDPRRLRAEMARKHPHWAQAPSAGKVEREIFQHWGAALARFAGRAGAADEVAAYRLAARRGVWLHYLQRPLEHLDRSLEGRPFWSSRELPAARALEDAYPENLAELLALRRGGAQPFAKYESRVVSAGGWSDVQFYAGCRYDRANCDLCPTTARVVASRPEFNTVIHGSHFFSRLTPGTHLDAHCGPSNFRLRCHLGLLVPDGLLIRCGGETRTWRAGECLIFDDSYEHEVWHEGSEDRIVLICDMWHPQLDVASMVLPALSPRQKEAFDHACRGAHLPLHERTYSTGTTVVRAP